MYARASHSTNAFPVYDPDDAFMDVEEPQAFYAGEPISVPLPKRSNPVRKLYLFLFVSLGAGACLVHFGAPLLQWASAIEQAISSKINVGQPTAPLEPVPAKDMTAAEYSDPLPQLSPPPPATNPQPLPEVVITEAPGTAGFPSSETKSDTARTDVASAQTAPADPYRKRAEAAGLHPDLSHVLLSRLTATDYRNAAFAIDKAVKTVPDDGEFVWPRSRKRGGAVFNVHFVPGAGHDCRRYVVTVTKDRWTTTALPMERCGVKLAYRGPAKERSVE